MVVHESEEYEGDDENDGDEGDDESEGGQGVDENEADGGDAEGEGKRRIGSAKNAVANVVRERHELET